MNPPTEATWIKRSEREPTSADFPVWGFSVPQGVCFWHLRTNFLNNPITHWMPANQPEPPQLERKSFREQDRKSFYAEGFNEKEGDSFMMYKAGTQCIREQVRVVLNMKREYTNYYEVVDQIRELVEEEAP